jgi:hypothetical protein
MTMSCTLATLAACFSMSGVYVDTGLDYQDVGEARFKFDAIAQTYNSNGDYTYRVNWHRKSTEQNPYGRIGLGYQMDIGFGSSKVILTLTGYHQSSIATGQDRGVNGITFGARYFPFARN